MRPSEAIIVFDGVCVLCNGWVRFLLKHDKQGKFKFSSMQSDTGRALLARYGLDPENPDSFLLLENGKAYTDTAAIVRVLTALGGIWRAGRIVMVLPHALRDGAYRTIARNRYRWFGKHAVCSVPDPATKHRFL